MRDEVARARASASTRRHSVGVSRISEPSRPVARRSAMSRVKSSVVTTSGSGFSGDPRRTAARIRARNSSIPNGFVT